MPQRAISLPFTFDASGGVAYTTDEVKIWQDRIAIVVMTRLNERVMRPTFGSGVGGAPLDTFSSAIEIVEQEIEAAFSRWLPQLKLIALRPEIDEDNSLLNMEIVFKYGNSNEATVQVKTAILNRAGETILEVRNG